MKKILIMLILSQACTPTEDVLENEDPCWTASSSECEKLGCGEILGSLFSTANTCFEETEVVGCFPEGRAHENATIIAEDLSGNCWSFSNTTIPPDWVSQYDPQWEHPAGKHPSGCQAMVRDCDN